MSRKSSRNTSSGHHGLKKYFTRIPGDEEQANRILVFRVVLSGTIIITSALVLLLIVSYALLGNTFVKTRLLVGLGLFIYLFVISILIYRYKAYKAAAPMFVAFYACIAAGSIWQWSVNSVFGILLCSLVIVLAGIIIRARYALIAASYLTVYLAVVQYLTYHGHRAVGSAADQESSYGLVVGYAVIFFVIALICWLYSNQMERSLRKAERAELLLQGQKANLELIVEQRTAALENKRLEELEQMYRFNQMGTLSTGLLHDLANYLSILNIDIEDLHSRHSSASLDRVSQTIHYIDTMLEGVRKQLQGETNVEHFNSAKAISIVIQILQHKAAQANVAIRWRMPQKKTSLQITGDTARFNQVMTILIGNAVEAYEPGAKDASVMIRAKRHQDNVIITIEDHGTGITPSQRTRLFTPFTSTKKNGMGIGLFLAKQIIQTHFKGTIELDTQTDHTMFTITIPASK
jgi:signal transduction histidine kinase